ncbi:hypothetical protein CQW23_19167 [Capsicum baccatum]|uniref:Uncharacterized protein n=1 Tax=Capsicum baccatum TaxID=33114 RepID=A0A2G2W521_CAPBA|nr:hypothetical protein CQW23_19167 [Capsicum baccatum]
MLNRVIECENGFLSYVDRDIGLSHYLQFVEDEEGTVVGELSNRIAVREMNDRDRTALRIVEKYLFTPENDLKSRTEKTNFGLWRDAPSHQKITTGNVVGGAMRWNRIAILDGTWRLGAMQYNRVGSLEIDKCENKLWHDTPVSRYLTGN